MTIVNNGSFCQVALPTGSDCIRTICSILRRWGFKVRTFSMGNQVTHLGIIELTMIDIRQGENKDTYGVETAGGFMCVNDTIKAHAAHVGF